MAACALLSLLEASLWGQGHVRNTHLFEQLDEKGWHDLLLLAQEQLVDTLLLNTVTQLPADLQPPGQALIELYMKTEAIEIFNQRISQTLEKIQSFLQQKAINVILLKGHANAVFYPRPMHRSPGDIDLYFPSQQDHENAIALFRKKGCLVGQGSLHHSETTLDGISVELHHSPCYFGYKDYDRALAEWTEKLVNKPCREGHLPSIEISFRSREAKREPLRYMTLSHSYNAFFLFAHLFRHFLALGIGLKQICDWTLFCTTHKEAIDKEELIQLIDTFHLEQPIKLFGAFGVRHLGVPAEDFPLDVSGYLDDPLTHFIRKDVLLGGNFGRKHLAQYRIYGEWHRQILTLLQRTQRMRTLRQLAPGHAYPYLRSSTIRHFFGTHFKDPE